MESIGGATAAQSQLDEIERLSTLPWTDYDNLPLWFYPLLATWLTALMTSLHLMWDNGIWMVAVGVLLTIEGAGIGFISNRRKASPDLRRTPQQFRKVTIGLFVGLAVLLGITITLMSRSSITTGAIFCFVASLAGMLVHRNLFERVASATRASFATS